MWGVGVMLPEFKPAPHTYCVTLDKTFWPVRPLICITETPVVSQGCPMWQAWRTVPGRQRALRKWQSWSFWGSAARLGSWPGDSGAYSMALEFKQLPQSSMLAKACALHPSLQESRAPVGRGPATATQQAQPTWAPDICHEWAPEPPAALSCAHHRSGTQRSTLPPAPGQPGTQACTQGYSAAFRCVSEHVPGA